MSTTTEDRSFVIPKAGTFSPSIFSHFMSGVSLIVLFATLFMALVSLLSVVLTIVSYKSYNSQRADALAEYNAGYDIWYKQQLATYGSADKIPSSVQYNQVFTFTAVDANGNEIDPNNVLRYTIFAILATWLLFVIFKKIFRTYGFKKIILSDTGIYINSFTFKLVNKVKPVLYESKLIPWDSILDIVVKKSDSVFNLFSKSNRKAVIYTMDAALSIEGFTISNQFEFTDRVRIFGESLEERVIDFGYGAQLAVIWRRIKRSYVGMFGLGLVIFFTVIAILAAIFMTIVPFDTIEGLRMDKTIFGIWNPLRLRLDSIAKAPSTEHWFGTDANGRDIFSRLFYGSFFSILIGVVATVISSVIGAVVGAASGYMGGVFDNITMRVADVLMVLPGLPLLIMISAAFHPLFVTIDIQGAYYIVVFSIFALIGWSGTARYVRAEVLAIKESEFVQAEYVLGATHYRIILRHIIPNTLSTIIIIFTLGVAGSIQAVATLSYLGFGSQDTLVWGEDLARFSTDPRIVTEGQWWGLTFVTLALFFLTLGFNLMGDALRDALDPRLKE